jgi:hypothetical protein
MKISGQLDLCGPELVEGWIYCDAESDSPIVLQIFHGEELLGECAADRFRQDLLEAGYGDGHCGFSFRLPEDHDDLDFSGIKLRILDGSVYLLPSGATSMGKRSKVTMR